MGIGFVLLFWTMFLGGGSLVAAVVLRGIVRRAVRAGTPGRVLAERAALLLPPLCVVFWGVSFVGYAAINDEVFHRDSGLGDSWYTPLPNGDVLAGIDIPDVGYIETSDQRQLVSDVTRLQIDGRWMAGWYDSAARGFGSLAEANKGYFLLNASTGETRLLCFEGTGRSSSSARVASAPTCLCRCFSGVSRDVV